MITGIHVKMILFCLHFQTDEIENKVSGFLKDMKSNLQKEDIIIHVSVKFELFWENENNYK